MIQVLCLFIKGDLFFMPNPSNIAMLLGESRKRHLGQELKVASPNQYNSIASCEHLMWLLGVRVWNMSYSSPLSHNITQLPRWILWDWARIFLMSLWDSLFTMNTLFVYCGGFWQATIHFLIAFPSSEKRPSCRCLVMLWYLWEHFLKSHEVDPSKCKLQRNNYTTTIKWPLSSMDLPWVGRGHLKVDMSTVEESAKGEGDGKPWIGLKKT